MKVKELIKALQAFDPELHVCTFQGDEEAAWCTFLPPDLINENSTGGPGSTEWYDLDEPLPRPPHRTAFVAL